VKTGIERIADERQRQIELWGETADHDTDHDRDELARAAAVYAVPFGKDGVRVGWRETAKNLYWPHGWDFHPSPANRIRELEKAGALIAAEIDRLLGTPS
jgi:hypothetical protein